MNRHLTYIVFVFLILLTSISQAQSTDIDLPTTQSLMLERREALLNDSEMPPTEFVPVIDALIAHSLANDWSEVTLLLMLDRAFYYLNMGAPLDAKKALNEIKKAEVPISRDEDKIRYLLLDLQVSDELGDISNNGPKRTALLNMAELAEDLSVLGNLYLMVGQSQYDADEFASAIENLTKAFNNFELADNDSGLGSALTELGNVYVTLGNVEAGLDYFNQALEVVRSRGERFEESILLYNIAHAHNKREDFGSAIETVRRASALSKTLGDDIGVIWAEQLTGNIYLGMERWQQALELLEKTTKRFEELGQTVMQFRGLLGKSRAYIELNRLTEAQSSLEAASVFLEQVKNEQWLLEYQRVRARLAYAKAEYKEGFEALEQVVQLQGVVQEQEQSLQIQRARIEFDSDLKERQNDTLKRELKLNEVLIEQQQQLQFVWIALVVIGMLLLFVLSLFSYKQIRKRNMFQELALKDSLTMAPNRRAILHIASLRFKRANEQGYAIALLDIDNFKAINDTYGHDIGDEVLIAFAKACQLAIRDSDHFGRYGGEEWLITFEKTQTDKIEDVFLRLREQVNLFKPDGLPDSMQITFSMGVASYNKDTDNDVNDMIKRADACLYKVKAGGKNGVLIDASY